MPKRSSPLARAAASFLGLAAVACLSACTTQRTPAELSMEQVCLSHHENNPAEQDRCRQSPEQRNGSPPDMRPQDLPVRTDRINR